MLASMLETCPRTSTRFMWLPRPRRGRRLRDSAPGAAPIALVEGQRPVLLVRASSVIEGRTRGEHRVRNAGLIRGLMVR